MPLCKLEFFVFGLAIAQKTRTRREEATTFDVLEHRISKGKRFRCISQYFNRFDAHNLNFLPFSVKGFVILEILCAQRDTRCPD